MDDGTFTLTAAAPNGIWGDRRNNWEGESKCFVGSDLPHFRLLYLDGAAYLIDSSLKDFGSRLTYVRMPPTDERERIEK